MESRFYAYLQGRNKYDNIQNIRISVCIITTKLMFFVFSEIVEIQHNSSIQSNCSIFSKIIDESLLKTELIYGK